MERKEGQLLFLLVENMNITKEQNRENSRKILNSKGIKFESLNNDLHWQIGTMAFYPTTLRWNDNFKNVNGIGLKEMLIELSIGTMDETVIYKKQLSVEQMFNIAKKVKPLNLNAVCEVLHKSIYKGEL